MSANPTESTNPFRAERLARSKIVTLRLTPAEYEFLHDFAGRRKMNLRDVMREALALFIDTEQAAAAKRGRK